ncbi:MAG: magnesium/cobalt transporter CorA [archaeon]
MIYTLGMQQDILKKSRSARLPPGSLVQPGAGKGISSKITLFEYNGKTYSERVVNSADECFPSKKSSNVSWINVDGLNPDVINSLGKSFGIHPMVQEDILDTGQRPKTEVFDNYIYMVFKQIHFDATANRINDEQISLLIGSNFVISFQEVPGDGFDPVRDRIRKNTGRIRSMGADYLAYSLLDAVVDEYFRILEVLGEKIDVLEEELVRNPTPKTLRTIYSLKREMLFLRKAVWPLREVILGVERGGERIIRKPTFVYLRDLYDHTIQVIDTIETFRDILSGMLDIYLSSISYKLNDIMKVLTIIATIFIPLTFITGIYGMNFHYMPEIDWHLGYQFSLSLMLVVGLVMVAYFKKRRWM